MSGVTIFAGEAPTALSVLHLRAAEDPTFLPAIPTALRLARDEIDERAATVAASARDGMVSQAHARRVIAALLYGSTIPESVAARRNGDRQDRVDIADRLRLLLFTKVMQETPGGFCPGVVAAGASACVWATQPARAALPSAARDALLARRERLTPAVAQPDHPSGYRNIAEVCDLLGPVSPDVADRVVAAADRDVSAAAHVGHPRYIGCADGQAILHGPHGFHLRRARCSP